MADSVGVLRPAATAVITNWSVVPGGTPEGVTSDSDNTTYLLASGAPAQVTFTLDAFTLPALAIIHGLILKVRVSDLAVDLIPADLFASGGAFVNTFGPTSGTQITYSSPLYPLTPDGQPWTQALVNAISVVVGAPTFSAAHLAEVEVDVLYNQAPVLTGLAVSSSASSQPSFSLPYSDPEGDAKERHQVAVFTSAQGDPFGAGLSSAVWYSGEVYSAATTQRCGVRLRDHTTYYVYGRAADVGSNGRYGPVTSATWTTVFDVIATPLLSVPYADLATASIENVIAQGRVNLLDRDSADFEGGVGIWAGSNVALASSTDVWIRGAHSLKVSVLVDGAADCYTPALPINAGELYTALATVYPGGVTRDTEIYLNFYDSTPTFIGQVKATGHEVAGSWLRLWVTARAPAGATRVQIVVNWPSGLAGDVHYVDAAAILPATTNPIDNADFEDLDAGWALHTAGGSNTAAVVDTSATYGSLAARLGPHAVRIQRWTPGSVPYLESTYYFACATGETLELSTDLFIGTSPIFEGAYQVELQFTFNNGPATLFLANLPTNTWQRVTYPVTVPVGATSFLVTVIAGDPSGLGTVDLTIDGVEITRRDTGLTNGGFETPITGASVGRSDHADGIGWIAESYPTLVTSDTVTFHSGARALKMAGTTPTDVGLASWIVESQDVYCVQQASLSFDYWWRLSNVRQSHVKLTFLDAGRQVIGPRTILSPLPAGAFDFGVSIFAPGGTDSAGDTGWVHYSFAGIPIPPGAVWVNVAFLCGWSYDMVNPPAMWVDDVTMSFVVSATTSKAFTPGGWSVGGYAGAGHTLLIERSNDGGVTWASVRVLNQVGGDNLYPDGYPITASPWRLGASVDYEALFGTTVRYRASSLIAFGDGSLIPSPTWEIDVVTPRLRRLWIKDPRDHTHNHAFYTRPPGVQFDPQERQVVKQTLGSSDVVVIADTIQREQLIIPLVCMDETDLAAFNALRGGQRTVLVQNHLGLQWYVRVGPSTPSTPVDFAPVVNVDVTGLPQLAPTT